MESCCMAYRLRRPQSLDSQCQERRKAMIPSRMPAREFLHSAIGLINSRVGVSRSAGVRVSNGDSTELLSPQNPGLLSLGPVWIEERVVFVGITVRPAVYGDALDIPCGIEPRRAQHSCQLITNIALEGGERGLHQFITSRAMLVELRNSGLARSSQHEENHGILGLAGKCVLSQAHGKIQRH